VSIIKWRDLSLFVIINDVLLCSTSSVNVTDVTASRSPRLVAVQQYGHV